MLLFIKRQEYNWGNYGTPRGRREFGLLNISRGMICSDGQVGSFGTIRSWTVGKSLCSKTQYSLYLSRLCSLVSCRCQCQSPSLSAGLAVGRRSCELQLVWVSVLKEIKVKVILKFRIANYLVNITSLPSQWFEDFANQSKHGSLLSMCHDTTSEGYAAPYKERAIWYMAPHPRLPRWLISGTW